MFLYFAVITCHQGTEVLRLEYTTTSKHSAFLAQKYIDFCPPAAGFKIRKQLIDAKQIARLLNGSLVFKSLIIKEI
jgi:hypothetical protein